MKVIVWPSDANEDVDDLLGNGLPHPILAPSDPDGCIMSYASTAHSN